MELYVHIPFCVRKCNYCDFLSFPKGVHGSCDAMPVPEIYMERLFREIDTSPHYGLSSIFIGGGTPSLMNESQMQALMTRIQGHYSFLENIEITMEVNPGTVTFEKLKIMRAFGINRLSMGLQTVDDAELRSLGRIHTFKEFYESYTWARKAGFTNINVDLISSIPDQTIESYTHTLNQVLALNPEHISAYSLIIEEDTPFDEMDQKGLLNLPDEDDERAMYHLTKEMLQRHGYERYELSNYAKKGFECKHNCGYWKREDYLGIGLGASSLINHTRFTNPRDMSIYLKKDSGDSKWYSDYESLSVSSEMEEYMFLGLRLMEGVSSQQFFHIFQQKMEDVYGAVLKKHMNEGLLLKEKNRYKLSEMGMDVANRVMSDYLFD